MYWLNVVSVADGAAVGEEVAHSAAVAGEVKADHSAAVAGEVKAGRLIAVGALVVRSTEAALKIARLVAVARFALSARPKPLVDHPDSTIDLPKAIAGVHFALSLRRGRGKTSMAGEIGSVRSIVARSSGHRIRRA
jgi:hypothetical protein